MIAIMVAQETVAPTVPAMFKPVAAAASIVRIAYVVIAKSMISQRTLTL